MPITGTETKAELRKLVAEKTNRAAEIATKAQREEATREEVAEAIELRDEIKSLEEAIVNYPEPEGVREQIKATKSNLGRPATPAPPSGGQSAAGDGSAIKSEHGDRRGAASGSPFGVHGATVKSFGEVVVGKLRAAARDGRGWEPRRQGQFWGEELKCFDRLTDYAAEDEFDGSLRAVKAAFTTTGAGLTAYDRLPGVVDVRQQRLYVADLFQQGQLDGANLLYVRETSFTNNAATVAEGAAKPEAALATEEVTAPVRKIAVYKKFSEELLADYAGLRSWIDGRLRFMVMQEEEDQLLNGDGSAPNLEGVLQVTGVQTESAASAADNIEAVHRGITKVRAVGFSEPNGLVIHPTDYQTLRLTRDGNDQFYGGGPFTGAYGNTPLPANPALWGLRTVITTAIAAGTVLVGDFDQGQFFRRSGVMVQMTNSDQNDFVLNLVTIRAETRGLLAVYRPTAFCAVTLSA